MHPEEELLTSELQQVEEVEDAKDVDLCGCCNVTSLPLLGQLLSLKEPHIEGQSSIRKVGNEFYGTKKIIFLH